MTENEAREFLGRFSLDRIGYASGKEVDTERFNYFTELLMTAMQALTEIQQYRAIGTVDECRKAREKQRGKKPVYRSIFTDGTRLLGCPVCFSRIDGGVFYCNGCGQKLDWSDTP
ncbi:hypothetical protein C810_01514 [Lachnospiraceae bacterium A2]|nr:hypothetical protein C810_01514 [Lachnospiraceae bacterium A2]